MAAPQAPLAFAGAKDFVIETAAFHHYQINDLGGSTSLNILLDASLESTHDSRAQQIVARSLPKLVHQKTVREIVERSSRAGTPCFVAGMRQKSNLAHICAHYLRHQLAASFFFPRKCCYHFISGTRRVDAHRLFTTIAYQLAMRFPDYRAILEKKLHQDSSLVSKCLEVQFRELIAGPFQQLEERDDKIGDRRLILVEGLDECEDPEDCDEILRIINESRENIPFRWLIFGRSDLVMEWRRRSSISELGVVENWVLILIDGDDCGSNAVVVGSRQRVYVLILLLSASLFDQPIM